MHLPRLLRWWYLYLGLTALFPGCCSHYSSAYIGLQWIHWVSRLWSPLMHSREGSASKCSTHRECSGMIGYLFDSMKEKKRRVVVDNIAQFGCSWNQQPMPSYSLFHGYHLSPIAHFVCGWTHFAVTITSREISNWQQKSFDERFPAFLPSCLPAARDLLGGVTVLLLPLKVQIAMHWMYNRCSAAGVHWFPSKSSGVAGSRLPAHYPGVTV